MLFLQKHLDRAKSWNRPHKDMPAGYVTLMSVTNYHLYLADTEQTRVTSPDAIKWIYQEAKRLGFRTSPKRNGDNTWSRHAKVAGFRLINELGHGAALFVNGKYWAIKDDEQVINRYRQHLRNVYEELLTVV